MQIETQYLLGWKGSAYSELLVHFYTQRLVAFSPKVSTGLEEHASTQVRLA